MPNDITKVKQIKIVKIGYFTYSLLLLHSPSLSLPLTAYPAAYPVAEAAAIPALPRPAAPIDCMVAHAEPDATAPDIKGRIHNNSI